MKVFVTDKYRVFTFLLIFSLFLSSLFLVDNKDILPTSGEERLIPFYSVKRDDNAISITFDCAWGAEDIENIVSVLNKHNCKATFFVLGTWAENYPDAVKLLYENGHEIANHSYNHDYYTKLTPEEMLDDIQKCNESIKAVTNESPKLFRAPSGDYNNDVIKTVMNSKMEYVQWSVDSLDWKGLNCDEMLARIIPKTKLGDILLFHNGTAHTSESLDKILTELRGKGFSFLKVSDLIYKDNYTIDHTGKQIKQ